MTSVPKLIGADSGLCMRDVSQPASSYRPFKSPQSI